MRTLQKLIKEAAMPDLIRHLPFNINNVQHTLKYKKLSLPGFAKIIILLLMFFIISVNTSAQIKLPAIKDKESNPVDFKIIKGDKKLAIGKETVLEIGFSAEDGYHINVVPPFKIKIESDEKEIKFVVKVLHDKKKLKEAEEKVGEGESVYLDLKSSYQFSVKPEGKISKSAIPVKWVVTVFYCSDIDGLCFRKDLEKADTITLSN